MIKKLLVLLLLSSCGNLPIAYIQNFSSVNSVIFGFSDTEITQEIFDGYEYSFIKVRFARGPVSILVLAYVDGDIYEWVGQDGVSIFTQNGRVIKTSGLDHNFEISSHSDDASEILNEKYETINLYNPDLYLATLHSFSSPSYSQMNRFGSNIDVIKIKENISIDLIGWNESNYYYKNIESGVIEKAKQHIHPRLPALSIEFYYKF